MAFPTVAGTLVKDIDPSTFGLTDQDPLTFANSGLTPVGSSPVLQAMGFKGGLPGIKTIAGTSGFSIARPVQDDFSIYAAVRIGKSTGNSSQWYTSGALIDTETSGSVNDWGLSVRASDGYLIAGTGNPDTSVIGTDSVLGLAAHIISIVRVKATGVLKVYVDGTLDITVTNNVNSLNASPNLYFAKSNATGATNAFFGRVGIWDAAHSDADRILVQDYLTTNYADDAGLLRATKVSGYAAIGLPPNNMVATKVLGYSAMGPGRGLGATKVVAYAVVQQVSILPSQVY
jgi:hypothetical protein